LFVAYRGSMFGAIQRSSAPRGVMPPADLRQAPPPSMTSSAASPPSSATTPEMRLVMMGTGTFAEPTFEALLSGPHPVVGLVTQPDRVIGQERGSTRRAQHGMK